MYLNNLMQKLITNNMFNKNHLLQLNSCFQSIYSNLSKELVRTCIIY